MSSPWKPSFASRQARIPGFIRLVRGVWPLALLLRKICLSKREFFVFFRVLFCILSSNLKFLLQRMGQNPFQSLPQQCMNCRRVTMPIKTNIFYRPLAGRLLSSKRFTGEAFMSRWCILAMFVCLYTYGAALLLLLVMWLFLRPCHCLVILFQLLLWLVNFQHFAIQMDNLYHLVVKSLIFLKDYLCSLCQFFKKSKFDKPRKYSV